MSDVDQYGHFMDGPEEGAGPCDYCGSPDGVTRICPYQNEINDKEVLCNCCESCKNECAGDI